MSRTPVSQNLPGEQPIETSQLDSLLWVNVALLLGVLLCAAMLVEVPGTNAVEAARSLRTGLMRPEVLVLLAACFFMSAAHSPFYVFFSIHLVDHGYDKTMVGLLWSLGVVAEIAVFVAMPRLMRVCPLRAILIGSFILAVIRFLLIGWGAGSVALLLLAQILHGATFGAYHAAAIAAFNQWFPGRLQARVQALYGGVSYGAGGMFGNIASGSIWDWLGAGPAFTLGSIFAAISVLLAWQGWRPESTSNSHAVR